MHYKYFINISRLQVALGTVTNINEAVEWLSYTYLFVRMRLNPQVRNSKIKLI